MAAPRNTRTDVGRQKAMGMHYTPSLLAGFVAERIVHRIEFPPSGTHLRILDPACGDGALLEAILRTLGEAGTQHCEVYGVEADEDALSACRARLRRFAQADQRMILADFLDMAIGQAGQRDLWESGGLAVGLHQVFDVVIANPPYVRTQVLGAQRSRRLAARFGLKGRVDLYHAFLVAATEALRPGGVLGIITSNRFLTTQGGSAIRKYLARQYEIDEVIDLGDTKLFEAAVLPAVFIGRRRRGTSARRNPPRARFVKVYSQAAGAAESVNASSSASIFELLSRGEAGCHRVPEGVFKLTRGDLVLDRDPGLVWSLTTPQEAEWLQRVRAGSCGLFGDIAAIRVGIKTTADSVFIRTDWDTLAPEMRPEPELLRPLLRHEDARRWGIPGGARPAAQVLYPHEVRDGCRRAIALRCYPRAAAYLESHRQRLEERHYVAEAGRRWYEIWVPQDPEAWAAPKIVFPDISPEPRFYLDLEGRLVDGDSYWITLRAGVPLDAIYLLLGVANSGVMSRYHDLAFNNKLYSLRRRYITQYVAKYPYPSPTSRASQELVALVKQAIKNSMSCDGRADPSGIEAQLGALVEEAFGLRPDGAAL